MSKRIKELISRELEERYRDVDDYVLVDCNGVDALTMTAVRAQLRDSDLTLHVVKNSLAALAFRNIGKEPLAQMLGGPCALVTGGEDPIDLVKGVTGIAQDVQELDVKGGFVEGQSIASDGIGRLAMIPSRDALNTQIVSAFAAPMMQMAGAFQALARNLAYGFAAYRDKLEGSES